MEVLDVENLKTRSNMWLIQVGTLLIGFAVAEFAVLQRTAI